VWPDGPSWSMGAKISLALAIRCSENKQYINKIIINGVKTIYFYMFVRKNYVTYAAQWHRRPHHAYAQEPKTY